VYKKLLVLAKSKLVARLPASDFPSENPRHQTRNFPYTNTLAVMYRKTGDPKTIKLNEPIKLKCLNLNTNFKTDKQ
jgi:hypothetical protein